MTSDPSNAEALGSPSRAGDMVRRLVDAWVAEQAGTLAAAEASRLDADRPGWRGEATQLIAEGLLAYVAVEMVAPDLAIAAASGAATGHADDADLSARLGAHLRDFVDYRNEFAALREQHGKPRTKGACDDESQGCKH